MSLGPRTAVYFVNEIPKQFKTMKPYLSMKLVFFCLFFKEFQGSSEELSTSSSQSGSVSQASDARISPPHCGDHLLVFPGSTTPPASPDSRLLRM